MREPHQRTGTGAHRGQVEPDLCRRRCQKGLTHRGSHTREKEERRNQEAAETATAAWDCSSTRRGGVCDSAWWG